MTDAPRGPWEDYAAPQESERPPWEDFAPPAAPVQSIAPPSLAGRTVGGKTGPGADPQLDTIAATSQYLGRTLDAFGQGWQAYSEGMKGAGSISEEDNAKLDALGVGPDSPNSIQRATWQAVVVPAAQALDIAVRAPQALYQGAQAIGTGMGLHRDIVSIPDAFMGSPHQFHMEPPAASVVPSPIAAIDEAGGLKRSAMAATGDPLIDSILKSPVTSAVIDNPIVDRSHTVPYTAGGSVPEADATIYIDHRFPKEIEAPRASDPTQNVKFDPAEPFVVHESVEQHTMELLTKGGMDNEAAYRVAHYEFAEKAEGAWYRAHDIDQTAAEKIYAPIMDRIQKGADDNPPENLYEKPYPHDNAHLASGPDAIDHQPAPEEIATARRILGGGPNAPRVTGGPADTIANSLPIARDMGLIGPERAPGEVPGMTAYHGSPFSFDAFNTENIGKGEGAQSYGHGLYFAESPEVALKYRERLAPPPPATIPGDVAKAIKGLGNFGFDRPGEAIDALLNDADFRRSQHWDNHDDQARFAVVESYLREREGERPGATYQVRIHANPDHLLDWDKSLDEQTPYVRSRLIAAGVRDDAKSPRPLKESGLLKVDAGGTEDLRAAGIPGAKYLDQGSRDAGEGTRNYVIFHHDDVEITHKNGVPVERPRVALSDTGTPKGETISEPAGGRVATDKAGNIRMDLIDRPEAVLDVIRKAAEENGGDAAFMEARRGQIPLGQADAIAQAMGVDVKSLDLQGIGRNLQNDGMVRTYIKAMIQSAENVSALAKAVALNDTPENMVSFQEARMRHSVIQEQVAGLTAEWGRTGNVFQEFAEAVKGAKRVGKAAEGEADTRTPTEKLDDYLRGKKGEDQESVDNLRKMAKTIAGLDPQTELPKMLADARKPSFWDKLFWYRSNNLISGIVTHSKYLLVNTSWMLWNSLVVKQAAALAGDVRSVLSDNQIDRVYHGESAAAVAAMIRAFPTSIVAARDAALAGVAPKLPGEIVKPGSGLAPGTGNPFESAFGHAAGEVIGIPGRGVTGIHTFYLTLGQRVSLEEHAYRQAAKGGAKPWTMDFWQRQADHSANPTPEALTQSVKDAYYGAFMQPLGEFGKDLSRAIGRTPLRWLTPFRHVPGNLFKAGQEMTPLAFGSEELRGNLTGKNGAVARDTAIARLGLGSALGLYVVHSVLSDRMTGDGPNDQKDRAEWLLTHQPNSVRIGNQWISYARLGPIGDVMGIFANLGEIAPHIKDEEYGKAAAMGVVAGGRWLTDGAGMAGLADTFDLMREPERRGANVVSNFVGGFRPFASALNQTGALFDPNMRDTRTFIDGLKIGIPGGAWGAGRESLPVKRDWLGNPVGNPMQWSLLRSSKVNQDPLFAEMQRLDIWPTLPERIINGVKLSPQAYDRYQVLAGAPLSMQLHQMVNAPGWSQLPDGMRAKFIHDAIEGARKTAATAMKMENYGDLVAAPLEAKVRRLTGQPPAP